MRAPIIIDMPPAREQVSGIANGRSADSKWQFVFMLAILMWAPLAFGANDPWAQFLHRILALGLFGLWAALQLRRGRVEVPRGSVFVPSLLFLLLVVSQFLLGTTGYRYATLTAALNLIPCGVLMLTASETFTRRSRLKGFCSVLAGYGALVAFFALLQDFSRSRQIYWLVKPVNDAAAIYGPYPNHNHYAGLMEMLLPLAVASAFLERGVRRSLLALACFLIGVSLILSGSRGGLLGLATAVAFSVALISYRSGARRSAVMLLVTIAIVLLGALALIDEKTIQHLTETQDLYRLQIYRDCLRMWSGRPLLGFGWGTFSTVYPAYRSFYTDLLVNHAHNDYLELLVETGISGVVLVAWFLIAVLRGGFKKLAVEKDIEGRILTAGALASVIALLAHSVFDFNLHIPANAALFFVLCVAVATPFKNSLRVLEVDHIEREGSPIGID